MVVGSNLSNDFLGVNGGVVRGCGFESFDFWGQW
jgi:hypothetical protein